MSEGPQSPVGRNGASKRGVRGIPQSTIQKDKPDLRDHKYQPSLAPLKPVHLPSRALLGIIEPLVRDQEAAKADQNTCAAQALAAVIDILRLEQASQPFDPKSFRCSASLLYDRGREIEAMEHGRKRTTSNDGLTSLRSAVKAFYHNGVCSDAAWEAAQAAEPLTRDIMIGGASRGTSLGSYYRLNAVLNDYHAAINDVGVLYAAAEVHGGWARDAVREAKGVIDLSKAKDANAGYHAFAIIGYNDRGFLVLNSWGPQWGGFEGWRGVALWTYRDWAARVLDAWVLRLGVSAPEAFEFSFGPQGIGAFRSGAIRAGSTPRIDVLGHYIHFDDSQFVRTGAFPSDCESIRVTVNHLNAKMRPKRRSSAAGMGEEKSDRPPYRGMMLWLAGGNETTRDAVTDAAVTRDFWRMNRIYPMTVMWCSDFIENAFQNLERTFAEAEKQAGQPGPELDERIEIETRGVGRAFWRDIRWSAMRLTDPAKDGKPSGDMVQAFEDLAALDKNLDLHVVAEGAGALLLVELCQKFPERLLTRITSITLLAPSCTEDEFDKDILKWWKAKRKGERRPIRLLVPRLDVENRLTTGAYQKSLLHLVQNSFEEDIEDGPTEKNRILGLAKNAGRFCKGREEIKLVTLEGPEDWPARKPFSKQRLVTFSKSSLAKILAGFGRSGTTGGGAPEIARGAEV